MSAPSRHRVFAVAAVALAVTAALPAASRERRGRARPAAHPSASTSSQPSQPPLDDLYRRRGYGIGGAVFGGDTAMAGSCADLRFAQPASCGRGYGIYGNGLGTRFGF